MAIKYLDAKRVSGLSVAASSSILHSQTNITRDYWGYSSRAQIGVEFASGHALIGESIIKVTLRLRTDNASSTDTYSVNLFASNGSIKREFGTGVIGDLNASNTEEDGSNNTTTEQSFTASSAVTIAADDVLGIKNLGSAQDIYLGTNSATVSNESIAYTTQGGSSWSNYANETAYYKVYGAEIEKATLLKTTIQGYDGGDIGTSPSSAAGGGGAGEVGESQTSGQNGGDGGDGLQNDITGTNLYYAGGGGGAPHTGSDGSGGQGGGGDANRSSDGDAGTDYLGGGGGGAGESPSDSDGGAGGKGVVIIRFSTSGNTYNTPTGTHTVDTSTVSGQTIIRWTTDGSFTPTSAFNIRYLVVGGGGSGGGGIGGGGGAGGYRAGTNYEVTAQAYTVEVGDGGAKQTGTNASGVNGENSVFGSITSLGGGYGSGELVGSAGDKNGGDGASGGGAAGANRLGGDGTSSVSSDLPAGSIFIETDTYKYFYLSSDKDAWLNYTDGDYMSGLLVNGTGSGGSGAPTGHTSSCNSTASTWTAETARSTSASATFGGGNKADHVAGGGEDYSGSTKYDVVEKFNGSSWSNLGDMARGRSSLSGGGNSSDAISFGGHDGTTNGGNWTEEWNGSAWRAGGNMTRGSRSGGGDGNSTNAISAGGYNGSSYDTQTMEYDGTSWTNTTTATIGSVNYHGGMGGNATNAVLTAGASGASWTYNGSSWSSNGGTTTDRRYGNTGGSATKAITGGGSDVVNSSHYLDTSDLFNGTAWASAGTVTHRSAYGDAGYG